MENTKIDIKGLLESMTLEEKIGQLFQLLPSFFSAETKEEITGPLEDLGIEEKDIWKAGTLLGTSGAKEAIKIQKDYLAKSEKKIPLIFMADIVHGYKTIFPIPLGIGSTWNEALAEEAARVSAKEASAAGVHVTFSPMVDLVRDARWGRVMESTGEDPYLNSLLARAFVRGYQGEDIRKNDSVAACVKHFAAYGAPEGGREYNTVDISEGMLREYYLPAYKAAIDEGAKMIMTSFNTVCSVPSTANTWLMRDILRDEWGFEGVTISDWAAVKELIAHGVAEDEKEAAEKAIKAGVDIEMMTSCYVKYLKKLIEEGKVDITLIDGAVLRILKLKEQLGLFENPFKGADEEKEASLFLSKEHRNIAREVAAQSLVLLKNENILPLNKEVKKLAIIGPYAEEHSILGSWSWQGKAEESISLKDGIIGKIGKDKVVVSKGCGINSGSDEEFRKAIEVAKKADTIILALGEDSEMSGECSSRAFIKLPGRQEELADEILKLGKKTAVILFNGRPLEIKDLYEESPAILEAWFPGTEGGNAIADILFGDKYPTGRLSMCFPYTVGQLPIYYNAFNTGRPKPSDESSNYKYTSQYFDIPNSPLLPFGFGLSYTSFQYYDFKLDTNVLTESSSIKASIKVKNTGSLSGEETVQLYIRDITGSVVRPIKELKGYRKVKLQPGEAVEVVFEIKEEMLRFYNSKYEFTSEKGKFNIMIGPNSRELQILSFQFK